MGAKSNRCRGLVHGVTETAYWLAISQWPGIGSRRAWRLKEKLGTGTAVWQADGDTLQEILGLRAEAVTKILDMRQRQDPATMLERIEQRGAWVLSFADEAYPARLLQLFDPPVVLLGWGPPLVGHERHLAVVGARRMTSYGRRVTNELIGGLAGSDVVIISGLALGIDGQAHRAALDNGLVTWAVLGSGFGHLYPRQHRELALQIMENGGTLLSEYTPDTHPEAHHFPARNRIIAALADAILVVEADHKSGSLITVDHGLDLGRDIWAVPGNVTSRFSRGTNNLLRHGATLIASSEDILAEWSWGRGTVNAEEEAPNFAGAAQLVYEAIDYQNTSLEAIVDASGLTTAEVLASLMELELGGWIEATAAQSYRRTPVKT